MTDMTQEVGTKTYTFLVSSLGSYKREDIRSGDILHVFTHIRAGRFVVFPGGDTLNALEHDESISERIRKAGNSPLIIRPRFEPWLPVDVRIIKVESISGSTMIVKVHK